MKVKIAVILTALIMASGRYIPAYADGGGQPPYIEPSAETTAVPATAVQETAYPSEPTVDPYEEMYQQQSEANANTQSLLTDIKDMIGGIMSFSSNEATENTETVQVEQPIQQSTPAPTPTPEPTPVPRVTETDGNGYIVEDTQVLNDGKEFLTMASKDGTTFYMVIDRANDNEVYLLNKVDNADLMSFTETTPSPSASASPTPSPTPTQSPSPSPEPEAAANEEKGGISPIITILLALGAGIAIYWFKFKRNSGEAYDDLQTDDAEAEAEYDELNGNEVNEDELDEENDDNMN